MLHMRANILGLVAVAIGIGASLVIGYLYGQMIGETWLQGALYSSVGVASVLIEAAGLHRYDRLYRARRYWASFLCAIVLTVAAAITITYEVGYIATLFEGKASSGETKSGERASLEAERADLIARIQQTGRVRLPEAIEAELAAKTAFKRQADEARAAAALETVDRKGCGDRCKAHEARAAEYMAEHDKPPSAASLAAELGIARATAAARERVTVLNGLLSGLADARVADARATYLGKAFGISEDAARMAIALGIVAFLFMLRTIGPYIFIDSAAMVAMSIGATGPRKPIPAAEQPEKKPIPAAEEAEVWEEDEEAFLPVAAADERDAEHIQALYEIERANEADLMAHVAAPPLPAPVPYVNGEQRLDIREQRIRGLVQSFVDDCLLIRIGDDEHREGCQLMQDAFQFWLVRRGRGETVSKMDFGSAMTAFVRKLGGDRIKSGSRYYTGVMLSPAFAADFARRESGDEAETREPLTTGRRLGLSRNSRRDEFPLEIEIEREATMSNA